MPAIATPRGLYEAIVSRGYEGLEDLCRLQAENGLLDFKQTNSTDGQLNKDDRGFLGKGISAFGNGDGGILFLGIESVDGKPQILKPIPRIRDYERDANLRGGLAVNPPLAIDVTVIEEPGDTGAGFLVIFIPSVTPKGFMSAVDQRFYSRAGGASRPIESTAQIQSLMAFGGRADLEIHLGAPVDVPTQPYYPPGGGHLRLKGYARELLIVNTGQIAIREAGWTIGVSLHEGYCGFTAVSGQFSSQYAKAADPFNPDGPSIERVVFGLTSGRVVFPGMSLVLGSVSCHPIPGTRGLMRVRGDLYFADRTKPYALDYDPQAI